MKTSYALFTLVLALMTSVHTIPIKSILQSKLEEAECKKHVSAAEVPSIHHDVQHFLSLFQEHLSLIHEATHNNPSSFHFPDGQPIDETPTFPTNALERTIDDQVPTIAPLPTMFVTALYRATPTPHPNPESQRTVASLLVLLTETPSATIQEVSVDLPATARLPASPLPNIIPVVSPTKTPLPVPISRRVKPSYDLFKVDEEFISSWQVSDEAFQEVDRL